MAKLFCISTIVLIVFSIKMILLFNLTSGRLLKYGGCPLKRVESPDECKYGMTTDSCNRNVCKRGPNEMCGGPNNIRGECGSGLICQEGFCSGCFAVPGTLNWECSEIRLTY